jgi:drug/metabolite transporter (DMT)-like permease
MSTGTSTQKWMLMAALAIIWGSSFILMKKALIDFTADQVASIRMFASFIFLFPFVISHVNKIAADKWKYLFASGLLGNGIPAFLFAFAQITVPSFMAGMLNSLTPVFTLAAGYFIFRSVVNVQKVAGVLLGLAGAVTLILITSGGTLVNITWHPILIVFATMCYAGSVNIIRHKLSEIDSLHIAGFALFIVGPPTGIYLFSTDFTDRISTNPHALLSLFYVLILALFGTAISVVLFNRLIKTSGAVFASSVTYLIPIVALMWGIADHEALGIFHLFALGAILGGVYLINYQRSPA